MSIKSELEKLKLQYQPPVIARFITNEKDITEEKNVIWVIFKIE